MSEIRSEHLNVFQGSPVLHIDPGLPTYSRQVHFSTFFVERSPFPCAFPNLVLLLRNTNPFFKKKKKRKKRLVSYRQVVSVTSWPVLSWLSLTRSPYSVVSQNCPNKPENLCLFSYLLVWRHLSFINREYLLNGRFVFHREEKGFPHKYKEWEF